MENADSNVNRASHADQALNGVKYSITNWKLSDMLVTHWAVCACIVFVPKGFENGRAMKVK